jgi:regulator of protease activity HflC (stomatin/prohibitin superfamily)
MKNKIKLTMFLGLLVVLMAYMSSCTRITPTEAGFKISNSGNYRGIDSLPLLTGFQFFFPGMSQVITIPTTMQHIVWTESKEEGEKGKESVDQSITINCMGGSGFKMDVGFNFHVIANKASKIYLAWKMSDLDQITSTFLRNVVRGTMQDFSGTMTVDSILNNLPDYEHKVNAALDERLANLGFKLDLFNIISLPRPVDPNLRAAIAAKIIAKQNAEKAVQELQISIAEANKKIATARGDSASVVIEAAGQAEAIKRKQAQVTPTYIDYIRAEKWNGALPTTSLGAGTNFLYNSK